jgi:hypothetical protein
MFGSVPLKTYLPDGDIDMAVFQLRGASVRDTWTTRLSAVLEAEARLARPAFRVKDVQVIHAEVRPAGAPAPPRPAAAPASRRMGTAARARRAAARPDAAEPALARPGQLSWRGARALALRHVLRFAARFAAREGRHPRARGAPQVKLLKCLVDNIVVDISFDTLNGLCTLAFLEVVDRHVGRAHLFKRSIILARPARGRRASSGLRAAGRSAPPRPLARPPAAAGGRTRAACRLTPTGALRPCRPLAAASVVRTCAAWMHPWSVLVCWVPTVAGRKKFLPSALLRLCLRVALRVTEDCQAADGEAALDRRAGEGLVLLREPAAGRAPRAHLHVRAGDHGAVHLQPVPRAAALAAAGAPLAARLACALRPRMLRMLPLMISTLSLSHAHALFWAWCSSNRSRSGEC